MHKARLVDRDEDGDPFDEHPWQLLVDVTVTNIADETSSLSSGLVGIEVAEDVVPNEHESAALQPGIPRRMEVVVPLEEGDVKVPGRVDIWLGEQTYDWTNLIQPGPAWSIPNWAAIVTHVRVADDRGPR